MGLPHGKCAQLFETLFGIRVERATSARSTLRSAEQAAAADAQVRTDIRGSPWVVPDETGWRVGGKNAWLHTFISETATYSEIGDRSGRIRTYNFPQTRVTDHRIGLTLYKLENILEGDLTEIIESLTTYYQSQALQHADVVDQKSGA